MSRSLRPAAHAAWLRRGPERRRPLTISLPATLYVEAEQAAAERELRLETWASEQLELLLVERRRQRREDRPA